MQLSFSTFVQFKYYFNVISEETKRFLKGHCHFSRFSQSQKHSVFASTNLTSQSNYGEPINTHNSRFTVILGSPIHIFHS